MTASPSVLLAWCGELLTRDFCPRYDPLVKWVRNPLAILAVAAVAAALCGSLLHPLAFVFATGLATVLALGVAWPWMSLRGLNGTLAFDRARAREGEPVGVHLSVRNRLPWGAWGLAVRGAVDIGDSAAATGLAFAAGLQTTEAGWSVVPACRGEYPRTPPRLATAFPFGIHEATRPLAVPARLLVWPRTFPVGPVPEAARGRLSNRGARRRRNASSWTCGHPTSDAAKRTRRAERIEWTQISSNSNIVVLIS